MVNGRIVSKKDQDTGPGNRFLRHEGPGEDARRQKRSSGSARVACNMACIHCGSGEPGPACNELSTEQISGIVRELGSMGVRRFLATGGEPLLRPDLLDVMEQAKACGLETGFSTNGAGISEENIARIVRAADSIQVSVDGTQTTHDTLRNVPRGLYRRITGPGPAQGAPLPPGMHDLDCLAVQHPRARRTLPARHGPCRYLADRDRHADREGREQQGPLFVGRRAPVAPRLYQCKDEGPVTGYHRGEPRVPGR